LLEEDMQKIRRYQDLEAWQFGMTSPPRSGLDSNERSRGSQPSVGFSMVFTGSRSSGFAA
jgi:hypothetical protein